MSAPAFTFETPSYTHKPAGECVYMKKYKWQEGYSLVYHERALHNFLYQAIENSLTNTISTTI